MPCSHEQYEKLFETAKVGQQVRDFTMETFDPANGVFGQVSLEGIKKQGKKTFDSIRKTSRQGS